MKAPGAARSLSTALAAGWQSLRRQGIVQRLLLYGSGSTVAQLIMMVYALLAARFMGPSDFGVFAGAYSLTGLSAFLVNWGMDSWILRQPARGSHLRRLAGQVLGIKATTGGFWAAALIILPPLLRPDFFSPLLMLVCVVDVWCDSLFNSQVSVLNIEKRARSISLLMVLSRGGRLAGLVAILLLGQALPLPVAVTRAAATLLATALALLLARPRLVGQADLRPRDVLRQSSAFGLSDLLAMVYLQADVTLLTLLATKPQVGSYSPAASLTNALFVIPMTAFYIYLPELSARMSLEPQRVKHSIQRMFLGLSATGLALALGVALAGPWLIHLLLGSAFASTGGVLRILSPILLLKSLGVGCAVLLAAAGWQHKRLLPQLVSALVNVGLNIAVIPLAGIEGVAWVYVISEVVLLAGYGLAAWRWYHRAPGMEPA